MAQPITAGLVIPSYPTPLITERVLVEYHDPRQADYEALEYGTQHPDPQYSDFILTFQAPAELDRWVQRIYVNERLNQDQYNYEIEYPYGGSTLFPRYKRRYLLLAEGNTNEPLDPGTLDPVFPDAKLVLQRELELEEQAYASMFILVERWYDVIPDLGDPEHLAAVKGFGVKVEYPFADPDYPRVTWKFEQLTDDYSPVDELSACPIPGYTELKLTAQVLDRPELPKSAVVRVYDVLPGPPVIARSIGQDNLIPEKFRRLAKTTQTQTVVEAGTAAPDTLTGDQTRVVVAEEDKATAVQTVTEEVIAVGAEPLEGEYLDQQGIVATEELLVDDGTAADTGFGIKASRVVPLGNGLSIKETETYPTPFPTFYGTLLDEVTGIKINFSKTIVAAGTLGGVTTEAIAGVVIKKYTEVQPLDNRHSIAITSWVPKANLPAAVTYPIFVNTTDPDTVANTASSASSGYAYDEAHQMGTTQGASGPVAAIVTETYYVGAEVSSAPLGTPRRVTPVSTVPHVWTYANSGAIPYAKAQGYVTGVSGSVTGNAVSVDVDRLRFDVFRVRTITIP